MGTTYKGRLASDGRGGLIAFEARRVGDRVVVVHDEAGNEVLDENGDAYELSVPVYKYGKDHGRQVKAAAKGDTTFYVFVEDGEPNHFEEHHERHVGVVMTQDNDPSAPGYAGMPDNPNVGHEHHWGEDAVVENHPARVSAKVTGHTEAYA